MKGLEFTRNQKLSLLAILGLAAIGISTAHFHRSLDSSGEVLFVEPNKGDSTRVMSSGSDSSYSRLAKDAKVVFQVAGHVKSPGVYTLSAGSRVYEAIKAAGGSMPDADTQSINLAARIKDASRIYVPAQGELTSSSTNVPTAPNITTMVARVGSPNSGTSGTKLSRPSEGLVRINTAGSSELQRLPGVGPATAQKIIDFRSRIGGLGHLNR